MGLDSEIFPLVIVENKNAEQAGPDKQKGEVAPKRLTHVF
jgi:hypothetical protein